VSRRNQLGLGGTKKSVSLIRVIFARGSGIVGCRRDQPDQTRPAMVRYRTAEGPSGVRIASIKEDRRAASLARSTLHTLELRDMMTRDTRDSDTRYSDRDIVTDGT